MVIKGATAVISGASKGIGRATAQAFADEGATVFSLDIEKPKKSDERITHISTDVTQGDQVQRALRQIPTIDILMLNEIGRAHV